MYCKDTDKTELKNKITDISGLVKKTEFNAKITKIEGKIPSINGLATNAALTATKSDLENKMPDISSLVKKIMKINLQIIIMINILLLQSLISLQQKVLQKD